jgi:hypothetical protein
MYTCVNLSLQIIAIDVSSEIKLVMQITYRFGHGSTWVSVDRSYCRLEPLTDLCHMHAGKSASRKLYHIKFRLFNILYTLCIFF